MKIKLALVISILMMASYYAKADYYQQLKNYRSDLDRRYIRLSELEQIYTRELHQNSDNLIYNQKMEDLHEQRKLLRVERELVDTEILLEGGIYDY